MPRSRRTRRTNKRDHSKESSSLFKPARYQKYADIVKLDTLDNATISAKELEKEFLASKTNGKKTRIKRVTNLAINRALASAKRADLSERERVEFQEIAGIYAIAYNKMDEIGD